MRARDFSAFLLKSCRLMQNILSTGCSKGMQRGEREKQSPLMFCLLGVNCVIASLCNGKRVKQSYYSRSPEGVGQESTGIGWTCQDCRTMYSSTLRGNIWRWQQQPLEALWATEGQNAAAYCGGPRQEWILASSKPTPHGQAEVDTDDARASKAFQADPSLAIPGRSCPAFLIDIVISVSSALLASRMAKWLTGLKGHVEIVLPWAKHLVFVLHLFHHVLSSICHPAGSVRLNSTSRCLPNLLPLDVAGASNKADWLLLMVPACQ